MEDRIRDLLSVCSELDFGDINLSAKEKQFYNELNNEIILLCKSLPESTHTDAILFFMRYSRTLFGEELNFFRIYYVPAWSIMFWLIQSCPDDKILEREYIRNAKTAHSMAMFLHALDDHLNDNDLPITHLALLLRSQSWMIMNSAITMLVDGMDGGQEIVRIFIDDYYSSIHDQEDIESLNGYCDLFRKQMATWMIVPVLMMKKMTTGKEFADAIRIAYGSFGIAWRLLDDINDIEVDMMKGAHSAIYFCLSNKIKQLWGKHATVDPNLKNGNAKIILDYVLENSIIDRLKTRICTELESAASIAYNYNITGLTEEFQCLLRPLKHKTHHL
jgi:hypothetical protein